MCSVMGSTLTSMMTSYWATSPSNWRSTTLRETLLRWTSFSTDGYFFIVFLYLDIVGSRETDTMRFFLASPGCLVVTFSDPWSLSCLVCQTIKDVDLTDGTLVVEDISFKQSLPESIVTLTMHVPQYGFEGFRVIVGSKIQDSSLKDWAWTNLAGSGIILVGIKMGIVQQYLHKLHFYNVAFF